MENLIYTSQSLIPDNIYTRANLKEMFSITDTTINTGVFRPAGTSSVWLFITENKPSDRTPYNDLLYNGILRWQGQMKGRKDHYIINHQRDMLELVVFYRKRKYEYAGAGFKYEGLFRYQSHSGALPASFTLQCVREVEAIDAVQDRLERNGEFDPTDVHQEEDKVMASIVRRRGQTAFRNLLMNAYSRRCAVTECDVVGILEAAHIIPYRGNRTNHVQNGLLLRADIHTLFDLHLLTVSSSYAVVISPTLLHSEYARFSGRALRIPDSLNNRPNLEALRMHRAKCGF